MRISVSPEIRHSGAPLYLTEPNYSGTWIFAIAAMHFGAVALLSAFEADAMPSTQPTLTVQMILPAPRPASLPANENSTTTPAPQAPPIERKRKAIPKTAFPTLTQALVAEPPASSGIEIPTIRETAQPPSVPTSTNPATPIPVTLARFDADYLRNPPPAYPALARRLGEEGKVILRVFVTPDGQPGQVELKTGSGSSRLDQAAQEAVARWKFEPARRGNEPISAWVLVPIVFNLRG